MYRLFLFLPRAVVAFWKNSQFFSPNYRLRPVVHKQLSVNIAGVPFDCAERDMQLTGDLLVGQALSALQYDHDHGHSHSHGIGWSYPVAETISRSKLKAKLLTILRELEATSKELIITAEGKCVRDEAEALTDRYFITPWVCLSEIEQQNQLSLAMQLRDGLRILEESKQA